MDKELTVGVDEVSIVLFYPVDDICADWQNTAYSMIQEFIYKADIELLLGKVVEMRDKKPQAYSQAFTIENAPYYFTIALHETFVHMGILIRFSAHSWAVYQKRYFDFYGENINIGKFLSNIESPLYRYRLSRIDLTADYKNYDLSPHSIYSRLKDESLTVIIDTVKERFLLSKEIWLLSHCISVQGLKTHSHYSGFMIKNRNKLATTVFALMKHCSATVGLDLRLHTEETMLIK